MLKTSMVSTSVRDGQILHGGSPASQLWEATTNSVCELVGTKRLGGNRTRRRPYALGRKLLRSSAIEDQRSRLKATFGRRDGDKSQARVRTATVSRAPTRTASHWGERARPDDEPVPGQPGRPAGDRGIEPVRPSAVQRGEQ